METLTEEHIMTHVDTVAAQLQANLSDPRTAERLKLTGLEVLGFLASKIVLPIFCGFVGRILYDRYKDLETNAHLEAAKRDLIESWPGAGDQVDPHTMTDELAEVLVQEGLSLDNAREIVRRAVATIGVGVQRKSP